jgi:hypothetical protein
LCFHAALHLNYFMGMGILGTRLLAPIVAAGVVAFICMSLVSATALASIRRFSYRVFFVTHIISVLILPPLLFCHAPPARWFMAESFVAFLVDLVSRKLDTVISQSTLESIPGTSLVQGNGFNSLPQNQPIPCASWFPFISLRSCRSPPVFADI